WVQPSALSIALREEGAPNLRVRSARPPPCLPWRGGQEPWSSVRRMRAKLSYANMTASLSLFIAPGGTSWAVATLPRDSVGPRQLRANAVSSEKVRDGSLTASDLAPGIISTGSRGPRGPEGPSGPQGLPGPAGAQGTPGPSSVTIAPQGSSVILPLNADVPRTVTRLENLQAGAWILAFSSTATTPGQGQHVNCSIQVNGDSVA